MKMTPKKLRWQFIGGRDNRWIGTVHPYGLHVRFTIEKGRDKQYTIASNLEGVAHFRCKDLEGAKRHAQQLFQGYALSLFQLREFHKPILL